MTKELIEQDKKDQEDAEKVKEEEQSYRAELGEELWGDDADKSTPAETKPSETEKAADQPKEKELEQKPEKKEDPPETKDEDPLKVIQKTLGNIEFRVKQTESRIGSIQNEMHAAKQVEEEVKAKDAPSKEQIKEASESQEEWESLKEEFPAWAKAIDNRLTATTAEFGKKLPKFEGDLSEVQGEVQKLKKDFDAKLEIITLSFHHPDWKETVNSDEYKKWLALQSDEFKHNALSSPYAKDAIDILNDFDDFKKSHKSEKTPAEIAADRKKRLNKSQTLETSSHNETKPKTVSDMTDAEYRADLEKEIWAE